MADALVFNNVEKQYGGLRPLRVRDLRVRAGGITMLIGFDRPSAESIVNLITGAVLPEKGEVITLDRPTHEIVDSREWLSFVEQFGIVSDRIVLLEGMTLAQNLAISFDLELDPVPPAVRARVVALAAEVGIDESHLDRLVAEAPPLLRSRVYLARSLALGPEILVLEHPTASLLAEDAKAYAETVKRVSEQRRLTTVGVLMDERFASATGGQLLLWQPATGELLPPSRFARLRRKFISER